MSLGDAFSEKVWERVQARAERVAREAGVELMAAGPLIAELLRLPREERLPRVAAEKRFHTLGLLERLLAPLTEPRERLGLERVEALAELALSVAARLSPERYLPSALADRQANAWSLWADGRRRRGALAEAAQGFTTAASLLAPRPIDSPERALWRRLAASLRWVEGRQDEALCLLGGAARLFERWNDLESAGEALCEQGWIALEVGDPESSLASLLAAAALFDGGSWPPIVIRTRLGLARCHAELGEIEQAAGAVAAARELYVDVQNPIEQLRFRWREAQVAERLGESEQALAILKPMVGELLAAKAFPDAAAVAAGLAILYAALDRRADVARLQRQVAPLAEGDALPEPSRAALLVALQAAERNDAEAIEPLVAAAEFLDRVRDDPAFSFQLDEP